MRISATIVLERRTRISGEHATHPYEAGWASEAVFFVQASGDGRPQLEIQAQISPDGCNWVRHGDPAVMDLDTEMLDLRLTHFGGWLRLVLRGADQDNPAVVIVHLALKS